MTHAKNGDKVRVHYTGTLNDGSVFDTSREREPLEFILGAGKIIAGFDQAVEGMAVGDKKTIVVPPEEAYGPYRDEMVFALGTDQFPEGYQPEIGERLHLRFEENESHPFMATVVEFDKDKVTVDANHFLAGKSLNFEVELMAIEAVA